MCVVSTPRFGVGLLAIHRLFNTLQSVQHICICVCFGALFLNVSPQNSSKAFGCIAQATLRSSRSLMIQSRTVSQLTATAVLSTADYSVVLCGIMIRL